MAIPASQIVSVNPGVISAGGTALALNGLVLSSNAYLPTGTPQSFVSKEAVKAFFGPASAEYAASQIYFLGFDNSTVKPGLIWFAPYNGAARAAWLQSGSLSAVTLATLKTYSGVLTITVDGTAHTSSTINLSSISSFSDAATAIAAGFTGSPLTCVWDSIKSVFRLFSTTTGTGSTMSFASGTLSANLKLTSATGALLSQGAAADTPATAMDAIVAYTQNWVSFTTMWEPDMDGKEAFAVWCNAQNQRYLYVCWDTDEQATINGSTTCFGAIATEAAYNAVLPVYDNLDTAMFALGTAASIDFSRRNGRITYKFKAQSGLTPTVTDEQVAANLEANGYSYYGSWATANDGFTFFSPGAVSGKWSWADTYVDQVYLNSQLQLALMELLTNVKSIPYNEAGYALIRAAMLDPISQGLNCGIIRSGISLSSAQISEINSAAGLDVSNDIQQFGYYLQILDPGSQVRGTRGTPVINFWYTDGGAVHKISLASIDIL